MLNQLVYTRCSPYRDLKNKGNVVRDGDGFGVFSMSAGLAADGQSENLLFLQQRLALKNASNESAPIGLFHSYEYFSLPKGHAFWFEFARPRCETPRKNGKTHRSGTYVKQCLIGEIEGYPFEWFGAKVWDAHLISENDYYLDDDPAAVPDMLPQLSAKTASGDITLEKVRLFADGREKMIKSAIWFVLQEYEKPESERKVLLIKDTAENAALWVAAVELALSPEMARTVSFSTNRSKLGTQADSALFYYTDDAGHASQLPSRGGRQSRRPQCMIVAYHPQDSFCNALRVLPTSNFVLLDGVNKTLSFDPGPAIEKAYYTAAVQAGEDISDFCRVVLPGFGFTEISAELPELFDAYQYLLDSAHKGDLWQYDKTVSYLARLLQKGPPISAALAEYLLDECLGAYPRMFAEDLRGGGLLLNIMYKLSVFLKREQDVVALTMDYGRRLMDSLPESGGALGALWKALQVPGLAALSKVVLGELLGDTELPEYTQRLLRFPPETVGLLQSMFIVMMSQNGVSGSDVLESEVKLQFICTCMVGLLPDPERLRRNLSALRENSELLNRTALWGADYLNRCAPQKVPAWWDAVLAAAGDDLPGLCRSLSCSGQASIQLIEQMLANRVEKTKTCDGTVTRAFLEAIKVLGAEEHTGRQLFGTWIACAPLRDFEKIIYAIETCRLSETVEWWLFALANNRLPIDGGPELVSCFAEMKAWAVKLKKTSRPAVMFELKRAVEKPKREDAVRSAFKSFLMLQLPYDQAFCCSRYYQELCGRVAEMRVGELHLWMLSAMVFDAGDLQGLVQYVSQYVQAALSTCKPRHILEDGMAPLADAVSYQYKVPARDAAYIQWLQEITEQVLEHQFAAYFRPGMPEQAMKLNSCDGVVREKLSALLQAASAHAEKPKGGFFSGLFGGRRN